VAGRHPRLLVSRTRPPELSVELATRMEGEVIPLGSAGAKAMAVVLDEADVCVHAGGQYEWDSAAPVAVALAAGFHASRIDGSPLVYDQPTRGCPTSSSATPAR
jgi:3'(2'), 5'-bisphosphate nucleotidase